MIILKTNIYMTKKQIEDLSNSIVDKIVSSEGGLADLIVEKLSNKQKDLDKEFIEQLEKSNVPVEVHRRPDQKEYLIMQLTKFNVMLKELESREMYEDAYLCSKKIESIKEELSKIK